VGIRQLPCIEPLESRVHLSLGAYNIGDAMPPARRYTVDNVDRLNLRSQLAGSTIGAKLAALNSASATFATDFDKALLDYMKARTAPSFDFTPADVPAIASFLKGADADEQKLYNAEVLGTATPPLGITPAKPTAEKATLSETLRRKGVQYHVYNFIVGGALYPNFTPVQKLTGTGQYIDWLNPRVFGKVDSLTISAHLQRLLHLPLTAAAYRFVGTSAYGQTIANTLYTWAGQAPPVSDAALLRLYKPAGASAHTAAVPASVRVLPSWGALDTGVRVNQMLTTYNLMLGTAAWTPELNTLFMTLMFQHGRVLGETARAVYVDETSKFGVNANPLGRTDNNKALQLSASLLTMARIFPEFAATRDTGATPDKLGWKSLAKKVLKDALPRNYRGKYNSYLGGHAWKFDGFHKEESPGYSQGMAETFLQQLKLSQINGGANDPFLKDDPELRQLLSGEYVLPGATGVADPAAAIPMATRVEALYQIANPDGTAPSVGDTPRPSLAGVFLKAQMVLPTDSYVRNREYTWPTKYPNLTEVFSLWKKDIKSVAQQKTYNVLPIYNRAGREASVAATVPVENRPNSPAKYRSWLPGAGYYMIRSDKGTRDDVQLTFDAGLMGLPNYSQTGNTAAHTQYDLLNFELYGYQRPLIEDPGLVAYGNSRERNWISSTPAHNSFTVDNYSHARMDGYFGVIGPGENSKGVVVTAFHYGYQKLDVDAAHPNGTGPALARTIWFDKDNTFLVVDWGHQTTTKVHNYKISFTLPKPPTEPLQAAASKAGPVTLRAPGDPSQGVFTEAASGGNVFILPLKYKRRPTAQKVGFTQGAQDVGSGAVSGPFVTAANFSGDAAPADRLTVTQSGAGANFVTLIHTYAGKKDKDQVVASAIAGIISQTASEVIVRVTKNGKDTDILFRNPFNEGKAPHLAAASIPTRSVTVPSRASNPHTGGYPDFVELNEGAAPPDLNGGKFTLGPGDDDSAAASAAPASIAAARSIVSDLFGTKEILEEPASLLA
jgi:hypothetical protein